VLRVALEWCVFTWLPRHSLGQPSLGRLRWPSFLGASVLATLLKVDFALLMAPTLHRTSVALHAQYTWEIAFSAARSAFGNLAGTS
jgi:hypothetical protein